jgi:hypothetical protein
MVQRHGRLSVAVDDRKQVLPAPQVVTLAFYERAWGFTGLVPKFGLLVANPGQL